MSSHRVQCQCCSGQLEGKLRPCFDVVCDECMALAPCGADGRTTCPIESCAQLIPRSGGKCPHLAGCASSAQAAPVAEYILCDECVSDLGNRALTWCTVCGSNLCEAHDKVHTISRSTLGHLTLPLAERDAFVSARLSRAGQLCCPVHTSSTATLHCSVCDMDLCDTCVDRHSAHGTAVAERSLLVKQGQQAVELYKRQYEGLGGDKVFHHEAETLTKQKHQVAAAGLVRDDKVLDAFKKLEAAVASLKTCIQHQSDEISSKAERDIDQVAKQMEGWLKASNKMHAFEELMAKHAHVDLQVLVWQQQHYEKMIGMARQLSATSDQVSCGDFSHVDRQLREVDRLAGMVSAITAMPDGQPFSSQAVDINIGNTHDNNLYGSVARFGHDSCSPSRADSPYYQYEEETSSTHSVCFSEIKHHADIVLSNSSTTATRLMSGCSWCSVCGDRSYKSGQVDFKVRIDCLSQDEPYLLICMCNVPEPQMDSYYDVTKKEMFGWYANGGKHYSGQGNFDVEWHSGDIIHLRLDCDAHVLTGRHERTGKEEIITDVTGNLYLFISMFCGQQQVTILPP